MPPLPPFEPVIAAAAVVPVAWQVALLLLLLTLLLVVCHPPSRPEALRDRPSGPGERSVALKDIADADGLISELLRLRRVAETCRSRFASQLSLAANAVTSCGAAPWEAEEKRRTRAGIDSDSGERREPQEKDSRREGEVPTSP